MDEHWSSIIPEPMPGNLGHPEKVIGLAQGLGRCELLQLELLEARLGHHQLGSWVQLLALRDGSVFGGWSLD